MTPPGLICLHHPHVTAPGGSWRLMGQGPQKLRGGNGIPYSVRGRNRPETRPIATLCWPILKTHSPHHVEILCHPPPSVLKIYLWAPPQRPAAATGPGLSLGLVRPVLDLGLGLGPRWQCLFLVVHQNPMEIRV